MTKYGDKGGRLSDERSLPELGRLLDDVRRDYLRTDVYRAERDADRARITRLEDEGTSKTAGNRNWLYGVALAAVGAAFGAVAQVLMARGH